MDSREHLERRLGHRFADADLLRLALTHRSAGDANNERLEYLGDAALGFVIAEWLWRSFPDANEHSLTLMRASLVKKPSLANVAREIDLGDHLRLGVGERKSGGHHRESILADTLEATRRRRAGGRRLRCGARRDQDVVRAATSKASTRRWRATARRSCRNACRRSGCRRRNIG